MEHDVNLRSVLHRLTDAGLQINMQKSSFNKASIPYLGHVISKQGLLPNPDHIQVITDAPAPRDMVALRSFLGLTSWFMALGLKESPCCVWLPLPHTPRRITLRALLRAGTTAEFVWTDEAENSFIKLKYMLAHSPALSLFDPSRPTLVSTDASDYGLRGILTQIHPDKTERTVAFASRTLSPAERKYSTVEKEALACVWTDHQALTTLHATKGMNRAGMRIARWSERLLCFVSDITYRPGKQNFAADCLSRLPLPSSDDDNAVEPALIAELSHALTALPVPDFATACASCPEMMCLCAQIGHGWPRAKKDVSEELAPYFIVRDELASTLCMKDTRVLCAPNSTSGSCIGGHRWTI
ncbi:hypothetical protein SKAU_G00131530 [Synaphobranchus kaupii]|uniref:Reverse transcriptase/retrotransposon-derived protein RNase H-like domain-containing protein n=1 Tax=Synaphobranchus kaupii TaxID=118154 RepID=A0A9Q1J192_SYNKA|nr:hypothetical protein SKAU_G00131530 [Synaphobranchus kaupii]